MNKIIIGSKRLSFIAYDLSMLELLLNDKQSLEKDLNLTIPETYPISPEALPFFREKLIEDSGNYGWLNYLVITSDDNILIGDCGYLGKPDKEGIVELGYSVLPELREKGYAKEMVQALLKRAFSFEEVVRVIARTNTDNIPSIKVLEKNNFRFVEKVTGEEGELLLWEITKKELIDH